MSDDHNDAGRDIAGRFRAGTPSPNPKGRPRKVTDIDAALRGALSKKVTVTEQGKRKRKSKLDVTADQLANKSASGDLRAAKLMLDQTRKGQDLGAAPGPRKSVMTETDQEITARVVARIAKILEEGGRDAPQA